MTNGSDLVSGTLRIVKCIIYLVLVKVRFDKLQKGLCKHFYTKNDLTSCLAVTEIVLLEKSNHSFTKPIFLQLGVNNFN